MGLTLNSDKFSVKSLFLYIVLLPSHTKFLYFFFNSSLNATGPNFSHTKYKLIYAHYLRSVILHENWNIVLSADVPVKLNKVVIIRYSLVNQLRLLNGHMSVNRVSNNVCEWVKTWYTKRRFVALSTRCWHIVQHITMCNYPRIWKTNIIRFANI